MCVERIMKVEYLQNDFLHQRKHNILVYVHCPPSSLDGASSILLTYTETYP